MFSGWSTRRRGLVAVGVLAAVLAGTIAPASAHGSSKKTFTADIDGTTPGAAPSAYAGDADAQIEVVLKNTSSSQKLGSANVTVPASTAASTPTASRPRRQVDHPETMCQLPRRARPGPSAGGPYGLPSA